LQSAFKKAGVKNIMVSLWEVADEPTQWLMTRFYNNALSKNMPMRSALREAQNWLRLKNGYENPYYWAAFVLLE
jgi:CHAT domain-containing protein